MGIIKSFFIIGIPFTFASTIYAFSLKARLPIHTRKLGQNIGMMYNYFKVILKLLQPQSQKPAELADFVRKTNLSMQIFNRENAYNIAKAKIDLKNQLPEEFQKDSFDLLSYSIFQRNKK